MNYTSIPSCKNYYTETVIVNLMNEDFHRHMRPPSHHWQSLLHMQHTPSLKCQCCGWGTELVYTNAIISIQFSIPILSIDNDIRVILSIRFLAHTFVLATLHACKTSEWPGNKAKWWMVATMSQLTPNVSPEWGFFFSPCGNMKSYSESKC